MQHGSSVHVRTTRKSECLVNPPMRYVTGTTTTGSGTLGGLCSGCGATGKLTGYPSVVSAVRVAY